VRPHARVAGSRTEALARQLQSLPGNPTIVVSVPRAPYRCPPAPYERARSIARYLAKSGKRGRVLILDANDAFPEQALFEEVWRTLYPGAIQRIPAAQDGEVVAIDAANEWTRACGVSVIGDSALTNPPRSATAGMGAAKVASAAIATRPAGRAADGLSIIDTGYGTVARGQAIGIVTVFGLQGSQFGARNGATGTTPVGAGQNCWRKEYEDVTGWRRNMLADAFNP
jgi:hypothetical protein